MNNPKLWSPIPTPEAMAREIMRITKEYANARRPVKEWRIEIAENINGLGFVAYPIR